jgi:hypothetical protein
MESEPLESEPLEATVLDEQPASGWREMVDNPWIVLGLLFFVMAALGLPLLWASRAFSGLSKSVLTIVVLLYTALIFYLFYLVMMWSYSRIADSL